MDLDLCRLGDMQLPQLLLPTLNDGLSLRQIFVMPLVSNKTFVSFPRNFEVAKVNQRQNFQEAAVDMCST